MKNTLNIGFAKKDITPVKPVEMCGYGYYLGRVFEGIDDPLYVRSIAFVQGDRRYLLVNCDLEGIDTEFYDTIKDTISARLNLSPDDMLLAVIHTHSGPAFTNLVGGGEPDRECMEYVANIIIECACKAFASTREVIGAKVSSCEVPDLSIERTGSGEDINKKLNALTLTFDSGRPLVLLNFGCHPVAADANKNITADYPGAAIRAMDALGYEAVDLVAFCGNINPPKKGEGCVEKGAKLAEYYLKSLETAEDLDDLTIKTASFDEYIKLRIMPEDEVTGYANAILESTKGGYGFPKVLPIWAKIQEEFRAGKRPAIDLVHFRFLAIGKVLIAGVSAEVISSFSFAIEKAFPEYHVFTMGNLFDTRRYLPSVTLYDRDTYETRSHTIGYHTAPIVRGESERVIAAACEKAKNILA